MALLIYLAGSCLFLALAYVVVGGALQKTFKLASGQTTPAHRMRDKVDYEPVSMGRLLPQHFSAISAAAPIVGPIMAGIYFGWGPAWLWVLLGAVFIGGIHDFLSLLASTRTDGHSIARLVQDSMTPRAHMLFLVFSWLTLIYIIIAFTDVTAAAFVQKASLEGADAPGPAVASSSAMYLGLAVIMGLAVRWGGLNPGLAKAIFLPLVLVAIVAGMWIPTDLARFGAVNPQVTWGFLLLAYCLVAAVVPVWVLLQPRGELGGYFLYTVMIVAGLGILVGGLSGAVTVRQPFFTGWTAPAALGGAPLFPILFITVACGACSGFHSVVSSGTTSKQLDRELDARPVGYGSMLLEGLLAVLSLATFMIVAPGAGKGPMNPNAVFASGIAEFGRRILGPLWPIDGAIAVDRGFQVLYQFALLCFATFVFDTLDACTRLARYVLGEALRWRTPTGRVGTTIITLALPACALLIPPLSVGGAAQPLWKVFWGIFGSANQLLAALALLALAAWVARRRGPWWIAFLPMLFMMTMTIWSIVLSLLNYAATWRTQTSVEVMVHVQFFVNALLLVLAALLMAEGVVTALLIRRERAAPPAASPVSR